MIDPGDCVVLLGPTGSGKTLFLRALALLDELHEGTLLWRGDLIESHKVPQFRSRVMLIQQRSVLFPGTVAENLRIPFRLKRHRTIAYDEAVIEQVLSALGRDAHFLTKKHTDLSGGERQIVAMLRALSLAPDVLLLDEPTAALDSSTKRLAEQRLLNWMNDRTAERALVWVTHDPDEQRVATRCLRMRDGSLEPA
jgi:putative ABC transport system ATP-binding protein